MVHYNLAGRVNSEEYAVCDRLLDIMAFTLPDCSVSKRTYKADEWPATATELRRLHGFALPASGGVPICEVVIWTDTGRLLCSDADTFSTFALRTYGVQLDLTDTELLLYIKTNVEELRARERAQRQQQQQEKEQRQ